MDVAAVWYFDNPHKSMAIKAAMEFVICFTFSKLGGSFVIIRFMILGLAQLQPPLFPPMVGKVLWVVLMFVWVEMLFSFHATQMCHLEPVGFFMFNERIRT